MSQSVCFTSHAQLALSAVGFFSALNSRTVVEVLADCAHLLLKSKRLVSNCSVCPPAVARSPVFSAMFEHEMEESKKVSS